MMRRLSAPFQVLIVIAGALILWQLRDILLLAFAAILIAILLRSLGHLIERWTPAGPRLSLIVAGLLILAIIAGFLLVLGGQLRAQLFDLIDRMPQLWQALEERLHLDLSEAWLAGRIRDAVDAGGAMSSLAGIPMMLLEGLGWLLIVLVAGGYMAAEPRLYQRGFLKLFPEGLREEADETLFETVEGALRLWLLGQLVSMTLVGSLTTLGLWLLGVPSALGLGFIAGVLEFIPYLGPFLSAAPAVAIALGQDTGLALWVIGLYLLVQQAEGLIITPLVQARAVDLPPALTIFAILVFGALFGPLGVLLATPLTVLCMVLVKKLWMREALKEEVTIPGEPDPAR